MTFNSPHHQLNDTEILLLSTILNFIDSQSWNLFEYAIISSGREKLIALIVREGFIFRSFLIAIVGAAIKLNSNLFRPVIFNCNFYSLWHNHLMILDSQKRKENLPLIAYSEPAGHWLSPLTSHLSLSSHRVPSSSTIPTPLPCHCHHPPVTTPTPLTTHHFHRVAQYQIIS